MKYFNFTAALLFFLIYSLGSIPPSVKFNLWLVNFIIPVALLLNIVFLLAGIVMKKRSSLYLLIVLVFGSNYLFSTIAVKSLFNQKGGGRHEVISVLNYNLSGLPGNTSSGQYKNVTNDTRDSALSGMVNYVLNNAADIQCYQEFAYGRPGEETDMLEEFEKRGYEYYFSASESRRDSSLFGIAIVSRFPILDKGDVMVSDNGFNRISYADIGIGPDTLRVVNVHLQSMQMKAFHPGFSETMEDGTRNVRVVLHKLKSGVFERSKQIRQLIEFVEASPHPVICAGDFNELPYSFSYQMLKRHLRNSFEESGRGFGFTYNGNTLSMLRIDNQFYSAPLRSVDFQTVDSVKFSDHFPLKGSYIIR